MILLVGFEMLGKLANPLTQNRNLDLGGSGVRLVGAEAFNQVSFLCSLLEINMKALCRAIDAPPRISFETLWI